MTFNFRMISADQELRAICLLELQIAPKPLLYAHQDKEAANAWANFFHPSDQEVLRKSPNQHEDEYAFGKNLPHANVDHPIVLQGCSLHHRQFPLIVTMLTILE